MTIEQKAKAYDEAIDRAKKWHNAPNTDKIPTLSTRVIEEIFPELKESEDERIRKECISIINAWDKSCRLQGDYCEDADSCIAWLEKQKVLSAEEEIQGKKDVLWCIKQASKYAKDENEMGTCWFAEKWLEKQGKKKPTDEEMKELLRTEYEKGRADAIAETQVAWSEEDKVMLDEIIDFFENGTVKLQHDLSLYASWLKSLLTK